MESRSPLFLARLWVILVLKLTTNLSYVNQRVSKVGLLALLASMISWGLANPFADKAIDAFSVTQLLFIEIAVGLIFVFLFAVLMRREIRINWKVAIMLGLLEPGFTYLFGNIGYSNGTVSTGLIVMATEVFFVAIIASIYLKEKISTRVLVSIVVGFFGVVIAVSEVSSSGTNSLLGVFAFLLASISAAFYVIVARLKATTENVLDLVLGQLLIGTVFALFLFLLTGANLENVSNISNSYWIAAIFSGIFGAAIPFLLFNYASALVPTRYSALALNAIPVVGIGFGAMLGRGVPTLIQALGGAIVVLSLYFGTREI